MRVVGHCAAIRHSAGGCHERRTRDTSTLDTHLALPLLLTAHYAQSVTRPCASVLISVVGLTGGIASGKSTVSSLLQKHNLPIIDADILAREVVEPNTPGFKAIINHFGPDRVLKADGTLDRARLGEIVFNDADERRWLNGIVHPAVRRLMVRRVFECWIRGEWCVIIDVPLLIEAGIWRWVGEVVVVYM